MLTRPLHLLFLCAAALYFAGIMCQAAEVTLAWDADPNPNVVGYRIHSGSSSRVYTQVSDVGNTTSALISNLVDGQTYFFAVTAYSAASAESPPSNETSFPPGATPSPTPTPTPTATAS